MTYRKPVHYVPPYSYCDRWCERCAIDKSRCLLYQTEMDDCLHREIDGKGELTPAELVERIVEDARTALRMVQEQARSLGIDLEEAKEASPEPPPTLERDAIVDAATALAGAAAAFVRVHGPSHPGEAPALRRYPILIAPKLGRATMESKGSYELADRILQAQVAHKALRQVEAALESMRQKRPSLADDMLEMLALIKAMKGEVERRWLETPCELLAPIEGDEWWGPLRDITPTLRHFRR